MTRTTPFRRIILQLPQILLTDDLTFILFIPIRYSSARQIIRRKLDLNFVPRKDADKIFPDFPGNVRQHHMLIFQLNTEHRVRQRLFDDSINFY